MQTSDRNAPPFWLPDLQASEVAGPTPFDVCVVGGAGRAGLPLALALADACFRVLIHDVNTAALQQLACGRMPFMEPGAPELLASVLGTHLFLSADRACIAAARTVIVAVGTPVDEFLAPRPNALVDLIAGMRPYLSPQQTVIIRSTVYPGTCRQVAQRLGRQTPWNIAYCPERTVEGKALEELARLPQIVSGLTDHAVAQASALFSRIAQRLVRVSVEAAELAKLCNNAWRYVQFATVNEFYKTAVDLGVDFDEVREAMVQGYARAADMPKPGFAAGPCLLKDTMQLAAFASDGFPLGRAAALVNEGLPDFLVSTLARDRNLAGLPVGILGMAFKAEIDDHRGALSYKLARLLRFRGATVLCSDEYIQDPQFFRKEDLVARCALLIVGVPHRAYRDLTIPPEVEVIDLWNILRSDLPA
jgi:UDP-N-acetyl-D-mannosaminuronic acid dehydrogenase